MQILFRWCRCCCVFMAVSYVRFVYIRYTCVARMCCQPAIAFYRPSATNTTEQCTGMQYTQQVAHSATISHSGLQTASRECFSVVTILGYVLGFGFYFPKNAIFSTKQRTSFYFHVFSWKHTNFYFPFFSWKKFFKKACSWHAAKITLQIYTFFSLLFSISQFIKTLDINFLEYS